LIVCEDVAVGETAAHHVETPSPGPTQDEASIEVTHLDLDNVTTKAMSGVVTEATATATTVVHVSPLKKALLADKYLTGLEWLDFLASMEDVQKQKGKDTG